MFSYKEARKYTKEHINGKSSTIFGYAILCIIFKSLITGFLGNFDGILGILAPAVAAAVVTPIQVGLFRIVTNIMNNKQISISMLFDDYKYFGNLFVIGFLGNLIISVGYKFYILGLLLDFIYIGILYLFLYNPNLSLGDFFNKAFEKIKSYFSECIILELSYYWPILLASVIYAVISTIIIIAFAVTNINEIVNISKIEDLIVLLSAFVPIVILTIIFIIILIIMIVRIIPRVLLAEAKFYSVFANKEVKAKSNFCPKCGSKVEGDFCTNCGNKIKE